MRVNLGDGARLDDAHHRRTLTVTLLTPRRQLLGALAKRAVEYCNSVQDSFGALSTVDGTSHVECGDAWTEHRHAKPCSTKNSP